MEKKNLHDFHRKAAGGDAEDNYELSEFPSGAKSVAGGLRGESATSRSVATNVNHFFFFHFFFYHISPISKANIGHGFSGGCCDVLITEL